MLNLVIDRISLQQLEYEMERADLPDDYLFYEIGYCGHPTFPYKHIQLEKSTKLIISRFHEEDHQLIYDIVNNKKTQLVCLYFVYRHKKNAFRTDLTNNNQKAYVFSSIYGDGSTAFPCHVI